MSRELVRPIVKWFLCADHDPIDHWSPVRGDAFDVWLQTGIGPIDGPGADDWTFRIVSEDESAPRRNSSTGVARWGRRGPILPHWDFDLVLMELYSICRGASAANWELVGARLDRFGTGPPVWGNLDEARQRRYEKEYLGQKSEAIVDLSFVEQLTRMKSGRVLEDPDTRAALRRLSDTDASEIWFWGVGRADVQHFWLSVSDASLLVSLADNISSHIAWQLRQSDVSEEREMSALLDSESFRPFREEIEWRVRLARQSPGF